MSYRVFKPVDDAWQLDKEYAKLPKKFVLPEGRQIEKDNENGSITILQSPDIDPEDEQELVLG